MDGKGWKQISSQRQKNKQVNTWYIKKKEGKVSKNNMVQWNNRCKESLYRGGREKKNWLAERNVPAPNN